VGFELKDNCRFISLITVTFQFHVLILIVVGVNGFTSFALIYVNKAAIVDYTISYSRSYQQWPPYLPLTNQLTSCSGAARYNTNAASLNQGIINNCSGHFLLILRQPSSVKRLVRNAVENNPKFMAVDARDEKVDDDMWIIYQIYGKSLSLQFTFTLPFTLIDSFVMN